MELDGFVVEVREARGQRTLRVQGKPFGVAVPLTAPEDLEALSGYLASEAQSWRGGGRQGGPDPYRMLGVHPQAPFDVITLVYKARAKKGHPDIGGNPDAWKAIQAAYDQIRAQRTGSTH